MQIIDYLDYVKEKCAGGDFSVGWLQRGVTDQRGIFVARVYMDIVGGNARDALILSQILYWGGINPETLKARMTFQRDDNDGIAHLWIVQTASQWADQVGFSSEGVATNALENLTRANLIIKETHKSPFHSGVTVSHIRPNWGEIGKKIIEFQDKANRQNDHSRIVKTTIPESSKPLSLHHQRV